MERNRQGGFALLIVLWTLVGLSLLVSTVIATADTELRAVRALRLSAQMQETANGAVWQAIFHARDRSTARWALDGRAYVTQMDGMTTTTRLRSEAGLVNPNTAPRPLLAALLEACGATAGQAASIAANMVEWRSSAQGDVAAMRARYLAAGLTYRPPQGAFQTMDEIGLVLGMNPTLLRALTPHLSVTQPNDPDSGLADPTVRQALRKAGDATPPPSRDENRPTSFQADITVQDGQGGRATRRAIILLTPGAHLGAALADTVHVMQWQSGD
ncbi:general secretion pathway protein GspK [Gluconacetobacter takamatsuzukensis]|uniref:General secretion pathway protein GspK n=1 Tax=Gluconacetobacter takamatsuzukensis TaxID=1286190 RepID=A0A7W4KE99_9PROT|nr:general secretion pathway protein GspK [Gluconacetobacter takamatsuzukensis]